MYIGIPTGACRSTCCTCSRNSYIHVLGVGPEAAARGAPIAALRSGVIKQAEPSKERTEKKKKKT